MTKKGFMIALMLIMLLLQSCGTVEKATPADSPAAGEDEAETEAGGQMATVSGTVIMGVVSNIMGNEITLKLIEPIEIGMNGGGKRPSSSSDTDTKEENPDSSSSSTSIFGSAVSGRMTGGGGMPGGGWMPGDGGTWGGKTESSSSSSENAVSVDYTGENENFYVPVGLEISSNTGIAITFGSLEKGNVVLVRYDEETGERIVMMSVLGSV